MSIAFLFPGQGSQTVNMLHDLPDHPSVRSTITECSDALHTNVLEFDSEVALQSTVFLQLALLAAGVATARALEAEGVIAEAVAGLSVGAFAAAVHCGVLALADACRLVQQRAQAMSALFPTGFGLAAIVGLNEQQVSTLVAASHTPESPVFVSNINAPRQIVVAGSNAGMTKVLDAAIRTGATRAERLSVTVPSHCPLLQPVADQLHQSFRDIPFHPPSKLYVGNVTARALRTANAISQDLVDNIAHGVRWHDATVVLEELGCDLFFEMPPGQVLTNLARQSHPDIRAVALSQSTLRHAAAIAKNV